MQTGANMSDCYKSKQPNKNGPSVHTMTLELDYEHGLLSVTVSQKKGERERLTVGTVPVSFGG